MYCLSFNFPIVFMKDPIAPPYSPLPTHRKKQWVAMIGSAGVSCHVCCVQHKMHTWKTPLPIISEQRKTGRHTGSQTDTQTDRQTDRQIHRLAGNIQIHWLTDRQIDWLTGRQTNSLTGRQTDRQKKDIQTYLLTERQKDRLSDRQTEKQTDSHRDRQTDSLRAR